MDTVTPTMTHLFEQLGLPSQPHAIRQFIDWHRPLATDLQLCDAPFWSLAQSTFLQEKIRSDDPWSSVIDALDASLREHPRYH